MTDITDPRPRTYAAPEHVEDEIRRALGRDPQQAPADPTDTQYVANSIDRLRYLDLKSVADGILGTEKRDGAMTPAMLADLMAEWAAANKTKVPA